MVIIPKFKKKHLFSGFAVIGLRMKAGLFLNAKTNIKHNRWMP